MGKGDLPVPLFDIDAIYRPFKVFFRTRRMQRLWSELSLKSDMLVLDVGGAEFNWDLLPERPRLILLNLGDQVRSKLAWAGVIGDGRRLPFKAEPVDLVYSNSVIEHLGTWENQQMFAAECRRLGCPYYVQTPNRRFPIEPHYFAPFIHWLPRAVRRHLIRYFTPWGWLTHPTSAECDAMISEIRLLTRKELQALFPDAEIWDERILGLAKSLTAVGPVPQENRDS